MPSKRHDALEFGRVARPSAHAPPIIEVLPHAKMRKQPAFLKYVADAAPMWRQIDALVCFEQGGVVERDKAAIRRQQAGDHIDHGSFPGSRRSEQCGSAAGGLKSHGELQSAELFFHVDRQHDHSP